MKRHVAVTALAEILSPTYEILGSLSGFRFSLVYKLEFASMMKEPLPLKIPLTMDKCSEPWHKPILKEINVQK